MFSTLARWIDRAPSAKLFTFAETIFIPLNLASFLMCYTISDRLHKLMTQYTLAHLFLHRSLPWMATFRCKFLYFLFFVLCLTPCLSCPVKVWPSSSKIMKNAFYSILKALFILTIFKFLSWHFGHVDKMAWLDE